MAVAVGGSSAAPSGMFVIGDGNMAAGSQVTYWGAQWWKDNALSQGAAPAGFKGYALNVDMTNCTFTSVKGSTAHLRRTGPLPAVMDVLVTSAVTQSGPERCPARCSASRTSRRTAATRLRSRPRRHRFGDGRLHRLRRPWPPSEPAEQGVNRRVWRMDASGRPSAARRSDPVGSLRMRPIRAVFTFKLGVWGGADRRSRLRQASTAVARRRGQ